MDPGVKTLVILACAVAFIGAAVIVNDHTTCWRVPFITSGCAITNK